MIAGLAPMDVAGRGPRLLDALDAAGCDALVVTDRVNVRWLTGFSGSAGFVLAGPGGLVLVTDGRYRLQAGEQLEAAGVQAELVIGTTSTVQREAAQARLGSVARIGLEAEHVTWAEQQAYAREWFPAAALVPTTGLVEALRIVKDAGEVDRIEAAAAVADAALATVRPMLGERPTEAAFALALDTEIRRRGAEGTSFATIVASGPNGAKPHHEPGERTIVDGDLVVIDFGALVDGYCSDMTRTVMVGTPSPTQARMLEVVRTAQEAGVAAVAPGVAASRIDAACRTVIGDAGWGEAFAHGTGHGVGLRIHEDPRIGAASQQVLAPGHVLTVEPGVYLPDHGGVRVEDTVVVTAEGCRRLTLTPKDPAL